MTQKTKKKLNTAIIDTGEDKGWTFGKNNLIYDEILIRKLIEEKQFQACRIFITGESHFDYLGERGTSLLLNCNEANYNSKHSILKEPLFMETKEDTIRMRRFDPKFVWPRIEEELLFSLLNDEVERLGLKMDPYTFNFFDFYESVVDLLKAEKGDNYVPFIIWSKDTDTYYHAIYLACLFLFGKPGYLGVHASKHFADPAACEHLKYMEYRRMSAVEQDKVRKLRNRYGSIKVLTNPEISFVVNLMTKQAN